MNRDRLVRVGIPVVLVLIGVVLPFVNSDFRVHQFSHWLILAIVALGLNLLTGFNGQISVGHSAFFGIGAYATGLFVVKAHWPLLVAVLGGMVVTFVVGALVGLPALRIHGLYLALVTLAVAVLFPDLIKKFSGITGGSSGLAIATIGVNARGVEVPRGVELRPPSGVNLSNEQWMYLLFLVMTVVCFVLARNIVRSRMGRAMVAIRDNEVAAAVNGVNVSAVKVATFGISAGLAGLAGGMFALWQPNLYPGSFLLLESIVFLVAVVVGGPASILGPLVGAVVVGLFDDVLRPELPDRWQAGSPLVLGILLVLLMFVAPGGIVGLFRKTFGRFLHSGPAASSAAASLSTTKGDIT
jgi:branched-chain amino acid transport system permease protein